MAAKKATKRTVQTEPKGTKVKMFDLAQLSSLYEALNYARWAYQKEAVTLNWLVDTKEKAEKDKNKKLVLLSQLAGNVSFILTALKKEKAEAEQEKFNKGCSLPEEDDDVLPEDV